MALRQDDRGGTATGLLHDLRGSIGAVRNRLLGSVALAVDPQQRSGMNTQPRTQQSVAGIDDGDLTRPSQQVMTPKEQVLQVLTDHGGEVRQSEIVSRLDWSESTVSRRLTELEEEGTVNRYQIGREKLVFLPGSEPSSLDSPLVDGQPDPASND